MLGWLDRHHIGDLAGLIGLIIAWLTFMRAKRAKEAAEEAAKAAHDNLQLFDNIFQISMAIAGLEEIKRHYYSRSWPMVADRCSTLRRQLVLIRASSHSLTDSQLTVLQDAIANLSDAERKVQNSINNPEKIKISKLPELLTNDLEQLLTMLAALRTVASGDKNGH